MPVRGKGHGVLKQHGNLVIKILEGQGFQELRAQLRPCFTRLHNFRPKATRSESKEVYLVCLDRKRMGTKAFQVWSRRTFVRLDISVKSDIFFSHRVAARSEGPL